jgi:hypothetical protein
LRLGFEGFVDGNGDCAADLRRANDAENHRPGWDIQGRIIYILIPK